MRTESSVTSLSWIPSEAVAGGTRVAFDAGFTHYDEPPPDVIEDIEALRKADRFRFANVLSAWVEADAGRDRHRLRLHGRRADGHRRRWRSADSTSSSRRWPFPSSSSHPRWARAGSASSRRPVDEPASPPPAGSGASPSSSGRPRWCGPP